MGILRRLFSTKDESHHNHNKNHTFIECLNIVQTWSARATIDPDLDIDNKALNQALVSQVTCPYCSNRMKFSDMVSSQGVQIKIKCPICKTEPASHRSYEYEIA